METKGEQSSRTPSAAFSRRGFLKASTTSRCGISNSSAGTEWQRKGHCVHRNFIQVVRERASTLSM